MPLKITRLMFLSLLLVATGACTDRSMVVLQERPVRLVTSSSPTIFPQEWRTAEIQATASALKPPERERTKRILNQALLKYPARVLQQNLQTIYVVSELHYRGIGASGTNCERDLYIANGGSELGYDDACLEGTFHHEFSSVLLWYYPEYLNKTAWNAVNPRGFRYGEDGVAAVKAKHDSTEADPALCAKGFLCEYSQASLEDDFNMLAEYLFTGNPTLPRLVAQYPKLKHKQDLVLAFYQKVDPAFTPAYFASLTPPQR